MGVAICIYPPLDWSGLRFPCLEPDRSLFFAIKQGQITNQEYEKLYKEQILAQLDPQEIYDKLKNNVLLCWENPGEFCHRRIVAKWLEDSLGVSVPEWNKQDEKAEQISKNKNTKSLF